MTIVDPPLQGDILTARGKVSPAKVRRLTQRERRDKAGRCLRLAIRRSDLKFEAVSDKDHGQLSRELDDKEKLSFHEMFATWPPSVWRELLPLLAVEFGGTDTRVLTFGEPAT